MLGNLKEKLSFRVNADWVGENFDFEGERGIKKFNFRKISLAEVELDFSDLS